MDESFSVLSPRHVSLLAHRALVARHFPARLVAVKPPGADRIDVLPYDFFTANDLFFGAYKADDVCNADLVLYIRRRRRRRRENGCCL